MEARVELRIEASAADLRATFDQGLRSQDTTFEQGLRTQATTFEQGLRSQTTTVLFAFVSLMLTMAALAVALARFT